MRIVLRRNSELLTIVRAFEARGAVGLRRFSSEPAALSYLSSFLGDGSSLLRLRQELEASRETTDVMRMNDLEVLRAFARMLASGLLKLFTSDAPRAKLIVGELPAQGKATPGKAPPLDTKPSPIIPPEYVILARVESNEVLDSTRKMVAALQALMHGVFSRKPPAPKIPAEYISAASETAAKAKLAIDRLEISIEPLLFHGGPDKPPRSALAIEYETLGQTQGKQAKSALEAFSMGLKPLLWEEKERFSPPSELAAEYANMGQTEGAQAKAAISGFALNLEPLLFQATARAEAAPVIATEYAAMAETEGKQALATVQGFAAGLTTLLYSSDELSNIRSGSGSSSGSSDAP